MASVERVINGIKVSSCTKDITGDTFGRLTVISLEGKDGKGRFVWKCRCICGNCTKTLGAYLRSGDTKSCGCLLKETCGNHLKTHGLSKTKEYTAWKKIKERVFNPNCKDYAVYSKLGMCPEMRDDFLVFLDEIGKAPVGIKCSIERIDNAIGYFKGNIKWGTDSEQARNKGMYSNNKTGVTGVYVMVNKSGTKYYVASWRPLGSTRCTSKYFSINKYGEDLAFLAACEYRDKQIMLLNLQGAGYSPRHGESSYNSLGGVVV